MTQKTLVIVTQTDKTNEHLFDKKILGLSSAEWIALRVGDCFKRVVFQKECDCQKGCVCVNWDQTLVDKNTLGQDCGVRLNNQTFAYIQKTLQSYVIDNLVAKGVVVHDRQGLHVDQTADIQSGVEIFAPNVICGNTQIKQGSVVFPYCFLQSCVVGNDVQVGPFATIRKDCVVGDNCRIGNFVELKNSVVQDRVKIAHLAYVGDAQVGHDTNVGCGVVFANFDGKNKHKTIVGKNCFLGCNSNLVAPLVIEDGCFVAAGTTVTKDLAKNTFAIGRARQVTKNMGD